LLWGQYWVVRKELGGTVLTILLVLVVVTTFVLVSVLGSLLAVYQIRDRLDAIVKLLEEKQERGDIDAAIHTEKEG
jgi:hypothetical protein